MFVDIEQASPDVMEQVDKLGEPGEEILPRKQLDKRAFLSGLKG